MCGMNVFSVFADAYVGGEITCIPFSRPSRPTPILSYFNNQESRNGEDCLCDETKCG